MMYSKPRTIKIVVREQPGVDGEIKHSLNIIHDNLEVLIDNYKFFANLFDKRRARYVTMPDVQTDAVLKTEITMYKWCQRYGKVKPLNVCYAYGEIRHLETKALLSTFDAVIIEPVNEKEDFAEALIRAQKRNKQVSSFVIRHRGFMPLETKRQIREVLRKLAIWNKPVGEYEADGYKVRVEDRHCLEADGLVTCLSQIRVNDMPGMVITTYPHL